MAMPEILRAIFWTAAVVCFLTDAWREQSGRGHGHLLMSLGLAFFVTPFAFDAWALVE